MKIKKFKNFESISGTEIIGRVGPNYGDEKLPVTLTSKDTTTIYCDINDRFYTQDDYNQLYNNYLKNGGKPLIGFNLENIETILCSGDGIYESQLIKKPTQISEKEFFEKRRLHKMCDFTHNEKKSLREIIDRKGLRYSFSSDFLEIRTSYSDTEIIKLDDYWYTICVETKYGKSEYFICDDFEELINYLS